MSRKEKSWSAGTLKSRGWTEELISSLLPPAQRRYFNGRRVRTWRMEDVKRAEQTDEFRSGRLRGVSLRMLCPAVFLLTFGTFLGAVWANISWGNYWAWDPKETWALVTLLVYSFPLHGKVLKAFGNPRFFHAFLVVAFLCVLVTYFGVNLLLGGMHSYA